MAERPYDIALFGATGFTGALTAEYLAQHAPEGTRWALAGRNEQKLQAVRDRLVALNPACGELPLLRADVNNPDSIAAVAESAHVVITTVGPYIHYGEPLVAACATAGTDYVDLTGEPEFVDLMWLKYHEQAERSGARLVHCCGFDSLPYDLGALYTVNQLPEGVPISLDGFMKIGGTVSGGTYHSAIQIMSGLRNAAKLAKQRREREARPTGRTVKGRQGRPHKESLVGGWVAPWPTIDPVNVLRSARTLERYGPEFTCSIYVVVGGVGSLAAMGAGAAALVTLSQFEPTRNLLLRYKDPGEGPDADQRARSYFRLRYRGRADGRTVLTEVSGGDPGYGETSKMLAECALCLAHDELPERAGQLTPAVAMGEALIDRLQRAGIQFRILE
jgi:short subunit dehydrogenase-like uncharacterized protein